MYEMVRMGLLVGLAVVLMVNVVVLYWMWRDRRAEIMWGIGQKKRVIAKIGIHYLVQLRNEMDGEDGGLVEDAMTCLELLVDRVEPRHRDRGLVIRKMATDKWKNIPEEKRGK
jgi:hypothetical protein